MVITTVLVAPTLAKHTAGVALGRVVTLVTLCVVDIVVQNTVVGLPPSIVTHIIPSFVLPLIILHTMAAEIGIWRTQLELPATPIYHLLPFLIISKPNSMF